MAYADRLWPLIFGYESNVKQILDKKELIKKDAKKGTNKKKLHFHMGF
jgi:hypothetical protein